MPQNIGNGGHEQGFCKPRRANQEPMATSGKNSQRMAAQVARVISASRGATTDLRILTRKFMRPIAAVMIILKLAIH